MSELDTSEHVHKNPVLRVSRALKDFIGRLGLSTTEFDAVTEEEISTRRAPRPKGYTRIPKATVTVRPRPPLRSLMTHPRPLPTEAEMIEDAPLLNEAMSIEHPLEGDPPPLHSTSRQ